MLYPFRRRDGEIFALLLTVHPISRFLLEMIRSDEPGQFGTPLTISQWISLAFLVLAAGFWYCVEKQPRGSAVPRLKPVGVLKPFAEPKLPWAKNLRKCSRRAINCPNRHVYYLTVSEIAEIRPGVFHEIDRTSDGWRAGGVQKIGQFSDGIPLVFTLSREHVAKFRNFATV